MRHHTNTDEMHVIRKRAMHRLFSRALRSPNGDSLFSQAEQALVELEGMHGTTYFVSEWKKIFEAGKDYVTRTIIQKNDYMDGLRDSSPFFRVSGYKYGKDGQINIQDFRTRRRLYKLADKIVKMKAPKAEPMTCSTLRMG